MSELAKPFGMALPSFMQHLKVLEGCGLVRSHKAGRVRTYELSPEPLTVAEGWMDMQRELWQRQVERRERYLSTAKIASPAPSNRPSYSSTKVENT